MAVCQMNRAHAAFGADRRPEALALAAAALAHWTALKDQAAVALSLDAIAAGIAAQQPETAAKLLGAADELRTSAGGSVDSFELALRERAEREVTARLGPAALAEGLARGRATPFEQITSEAKQAAQGHSSSISA
jgi:hypothetical protein